MEYLYQAFISGIISQTPCVLHGYKYSWYQIWGHSIKLQNTFSTLEDIAFTQFDVVNGLLIECYLRFVYIFKFKSNKLKFSRLNYHTLTWHWHKCITVWLQGFSNMIFNWLTFSGTVTLSSISVYTRWPKNIFFMSWSFVNEDDMKRGCFLSMRHMVKWPLVSAYDDIIKWKHFQRYWPFVRGIHRLPVNSPHKG